MQTISLILILIFGSYFITTIGLIFVRTQSIRTNFFDEPEGRSSHKNEVPTLGGISFFISFMFLIAGTYGLGNTDEIISLVLAISVMFITGLVDDIYNVSAKKKLAGQFIAAVIILLIAKFRIQSLYGIFGVHELSKIISIPFTILLVLAIVNSFNLIDGIDGMASIVGIVIFSSFGLLFYSVKDYFYLFFCLSSISMLVAFLRYNFSSKKKMFMGDTGALILGVCFSFLTLKILSQKPNNSFLIGTEDANIIIVLMSIFFIPLIDVIRVIILRILRKKAIFSPDRYHVHHVIIDTGISHKKASILIGIVNILVITTMLMAVNLFSTLTCVLILLFLNIVFVLIIFNLNKNYFALRAKIKLRHIYQQKK